MTRNLTQRRKETPYDVRILAFVFYSGRYFHLHRRAAAPEGNHGGNVGGSEMDPRPHSHARWFLSMLVGLFLFGRATELRPQTRRWVRLATVGAALQVVEMVLHTASAVDHANLVAGHHTPCPHHSPLACSGVFGKHQPVYNFECCCFYFSEMEFW